MFSHLKNFSSFNGFSVLETDESRLNLGYWLMGRFRQKKIKFEDNC